MEAERQRLTFEERSNLVAYLDGELGPGDSQALASKLSRSPTAQRELEGLRRTWQLLDLLERPATSPEFTSRTLTLVGGVTSIDDRLARAAWQAARWGALVLLATLLLLAGFATTRWLWPDRTARLAEDLSIAEHLDAYRAVGSYEFLRQLDESSEIDRLADSPR